jgi:RNA polymerase sigma-70 factor, ECF subfamily
MHKAEDKLLVKAVLSGDRDMYAHLVNRYQRQMYNLAFRMTMNREVAQDLAQETFVRAYANLYRYNLEKSFFTWLYTICINLTRNHLSKRREILTESGDQSATWEDLNPSQGHRSPETAIIEKQDIDGLETALTALPEDLRAAVVLRYMQELPFDIVADTLGVSLSAAKMRVYRGLEKMREVLTAQESLS